MPAATVGAAYAEQKHLDRAYKPYRENVKDYTVKELVETLVDFSGLESRVLYNPLPSK